jgi:hypothetical protein
MLYPGSDLHLILSVNRPKKIGHPWGRISIAKAVLPQGTALDEFILQQYENKADSMRNISNGQVEINGFIVNQTLYEEAMGEPWMDVEDLWLETDESVYIIELQTINLDVYKGVFQEMIDSLQWK